MALTYGIDELQALYQVGNDGSAVSAGGGGVLRITELTEEVVVAQVTLDERDTRIGGTVAGLTLFRIVDGVGYIATVAHSPRGSGHPFTVDVGMQFLRPAPVGDLVATARMLRFGRRLSVVDVTLTSPLVPDGPVAHAVITFAPHFAP